MSIAPQLVRAGRGVNGSAFLVGGMNSNTDPMFVDDRSYVSAMNVVNRGGIVQSRPGYLGRFQLPPGKLQGGTFFKPLDSSPYLVFAVSGLIYVSRYPFTSYAVVPGIQFFHSAPKIYWASTIKSVQYNSDGTLSVIDPVRVLVMQDGGFTRAAYWDGAAATHSDPSAGGIPLGGPMAWSGDRLWVANKNRLYAGDISDPISFRETTYLAEGGSFFTQEEITGLADVPGIQHAQLIAFSDFKTELFLSGVRDRALWKTISTPRPFQSILFPSIGCVAHRSIVSQNGLLWWMSHSGITSLDVAQQAAVSSAQPPQDSEMAVSKGNLSPNIRDICAGSFENYGLFSVPSGHKWNRHTWVIDHATFAELGKTPAKAWNSVWTGTNPVEWMWGSCLGVNRIFHVSVDHDGNNRLWECFTADRLDNGQPITSYLETKTHIDFSDKATGLDLKRFKYAEVTFTEMFGDVSAAVYWAGTRGRYKKIAEYNFSATQGSLQSGVNVTLGTPIVGYRPQSRVVRTPEFNPDSLVDSDCSACGAESTRQDHIDVGFSLLIVWSGRAAVRSYRIYADPETEQSVGNCAADESTETNIVKNLLCEAEFTQ
jgi:hypothetical protein